VDPSHFSRTYVGPDFSVEEQVWVPLDKPAALIRYTVRSVHSVQVIVRFHPSLNLMWPAAVGGQEARWDNVQSGYVLTEPSKTFAAALLAPGATAHDELLNTTRQLEQSDELTVALDEKSPQVLFARLRTGAEEGSELDLRSAQGLLTSQQWKQDSRKHDADVLASGVQIDTPDDDLNRALAWAEVALDQAWICTGKLGCAYAGGFGPSRRSRRPQYAWYFAGDGMISMRAALAAGDYEHARDEIRFIAKYQDFNSGMIWHELSQSAPYLDWRGKYPYLFVHAEVTYSYIPAVAEYVRTTNNRAFLREIWPSVEKAFSYCRKLIDADGLPEIPAGKLGMDEQNPMRDELELSADWILACAGYSTLAALIGDGNAAQQAQLSAQKAKASFANRYWDPQRNFAVQGHLRNGQPMEGRGLGPIAAVEHHLFNDAQSEQVLADVASWRFQSDWGTRSVAEGDPGYDPAGYAHGSVWGLSTTRAAQAFWAMHWPEVAWQIWRRLIPWSTVDSPGHMDEVLAGDTYHPQAESVPEQTWSSASFLISAVRGLFGIDVDAEHAEVNLSPHLPDEWDRAEIRHITVASSTLNFAFQQSLQALTLRLENRGAPVHVRFHPKIPLGSKILGATVGGRNAAVTLDHNEQDEHASMEFDARAGTTEVTVRFSGGIVIAVPLRTPPLGDPSTGLKLVSEWLSGNELRVAADVIGGEDNSFSIRTTRGIASADSAKVERIAGDLYTVLLDGRSESRGYERRTIVISLAQ
jgi:glycogen debranching enzyme